MFLWLSNDVKILRLSFGKAAVNPFGDDENDVDVKHLLKSHFNVIIPLY